LHWYKVQDQIRRLHDNMKVETHIHRRWGGGGDLAKAYLCNFQDNIHTQMGGGRLGKSSL